jgi:DNA repair exonuclease SbcCD ATPase subunit
MKLADLDNPLGDLGGADLGDEWLESLKNELEVESAPQEPPPLPLPVPISTVLGYGKPILPQVAQAVSRIPTIPKDAGRVELLEARVKDLETKLVTSFEDMERKQRELDDLVHNGEAAQSLFEEKTLLSMDLENRLGTTERALEELRGQEQEARERLQEKTRLTLDLMESNQLLQAQLAEAKEEADRSAQALQARAEALESERGEALGAREQLELELAELRSRVAEQQANHHRQQMELLAAIDDREGRLGRMQETLNGLQEQIQSLEQEMEAGVAQFQTRTSRLQAVIERLSDLEAQTRQALEFAKTEME